MPPTQIGGFNDSHSNRISRAVCLTIASGIAATSIVIFGDTRRNAGHRAVAIDSHKSQ